MKRLIGLAVIILALAACGQLFTGIDQFKPKDVADQSSAVRSFQANPEASAAKAKKEMLTVMTRNIYVGFDVDEVLTSLPGDIPQAVAEAFQDLVAADFPSRAKALAKEIAAAGPHLVGLQEVSRIRIQSPGDAIFGGTEPATEVFLDYLDILLAALKAKGVSYEVAAEVQNADIEMPMFVGFDPSGALFDDVRLTDRDVILARSDVEVDELYTKNFNVFLTVPVLNIPIPRGFAAVDATIGEQTYRFVNTHLEPADEESPIIFIQNAQAAELIDYLQSETLPVVLVGDLNSEAPEGSSYRKFIEDVYLDVWELPQKKRQKDSGFTFGHEADLRNKKVDFDRRIDFILVRLPNDSYSIEQLSVEVVGDEPGHRTPGPDRLWPSDHGGVVAEMLIKL